MLGPMSRKDLEDLAQTGGVLASDEVRQGDDGHWRPASEIRGLFAAAVPKTAPAEQKRGSSTNAQPEAPQPAGDTTKEPGQTAPDVSPQTAELAALLTSPPDELSDVDELDFELNLPEPEQPATPPPLPKSPEKPKTSTADGVTTEKEHASKPSADPPAIDDSSIQHTSPAAARTVPPPLPPKRPLPEPPLPLPPSDVKPPPRVAAPSPRPAPVSQTRSAPEPHLVLPRPGMTKRPGWLVPAIAVAAAASLVFAAVWWLRPDREPDLYASLSGIYKEWKQHRAGEATVAWPAFVNRARAEIDETVPWLEENVSPGNRRQCLLLFAGRDLREALSHPPDSEAPHEERLNGFFEQLDEIYAVGE